MTQAEAADMAGLCLPMGLVAPVEVDYHQMCLKAQTQQIGLLMAPQLPPA